MPNWNKSMIKWVALLAVGAVLVGWWRYHLFQKLSNHSIETSLKADGRFISSTIQQYLEEHPEVESIEWEEFVPLADEWFGSHEWVSWDSDATYDAEVSRDGGVVRMTHPKLDESVNYTY